MTVPTQSLDCVQPAAALGYAACCDPDNPSPAEPPVFPFSTYSHLRLTAGCLGQSGSRLHAVQGGFALVVTLTLMVLLAILAVGLLSLSSVSLGTSNGA